MKQLNFTGFINPVMLRSLPLDAVVEKGAVEVCGDRLTFAGGDAYPDGTKVRVSCGRDFYCQSLDEIALEAETLPRAAEKRREQIRRETAEREAENLKFNASLDIPVNWCPEIKIVLSGLSERSSGNGCFKNTVFHIFLLDNLDAGKLQRKSHEYLCSSPKSKFSPSHYWDKKPPELENGKVNCKKCLEIAERWQKNK